MEPLRQKRRMTAKEGAEKLGVTPRHVRNLVAQTREEWITEKATEREAIRAYHDEGGHSWPETGKHFGLAEDTVKRRAYRARKERAAEKAAIAKGPTLFDDDVFPDAR